MINSAYAMISGIAVIGYLLIFMVFVNAEKNKLVQSFLAIVLSMVLWTGGSLLMRLQAFPSHIFWYHISLGGMFLMMLGYYHFVENYYEEKRTLKRLVYTLTAGIAFVLNIPSGIFFPWPNIVQEGSRTVMVYEDITIFAAVYLIIGTVIVGNILWIILKNSKSRGKRKRPTKPLAFGILAIFLGNAALLLPLFRSFPIDIVAGLVNVFFLVYVLVQRELFRFKMIAYKNVGFTFSFIAGFTLFYALHPLFSAFARQRLFLSQESQVFFHIGVFTVIAGGMYFLWKTLVSAVFIKAQEYQAEVLKEFNAKVSKSLRAEKVYGETMESLEKSVGATEIYIFVFDPEEDRFISVMSDQPLKKASFTFRKDHPLLKWMKEQESVVLMKSFEHSIHYRSLWEEEKRMLDSLGSTHGVAIKASDHISGIILLSFSKEKNHSRGEDFGTVLSIATIASAAIENAQRYEKAHKEASTDQLTETLNRRYFYPLGQELFEKHKNQAISFLIVNLDDFKLFNQLYGVKKGDEALREVASILKGTVGNYGEVARYGGKEFALILPDFDAYKAKEMAVSLRDQIEQIGQKNAQDFQKKITVSIGICVYPYGASRFEELIENAEHAVYEVKRNGKNAIKVFNTYVDGKEPQTIDVQSIYDEYKSTIYALTAAIDAKDHYTFQHSENVAAYAVSLARKIRLNDDIVENVRQAALLHDIGKISIPEHILNKKDGLTDSEYEVMKKHVEASIDIIRHLPSLDYVVPAVLGHHERFDGKGYPRRISGEDIPITARILSLADAYDAITSNRCYRPKSNPEKALGIIEEAAGTQFDPKLAPLFVEMMRKKEWYYEDDVEEDTAVQNLFQ
ncbi:MAG TPA: diguanylate cyclase [Eubacteriaceae bacterium]|nr:diguanylate cyclase [Eubacteriaceae bacterium]